MLYESDVIDAVCSFLESQDFTIEQRLSEIEQGVDIIAKSGNINFYIEAKGETSSKSHTNRYGKQFTTSQVRDHISVALYKSAELLTTYSQNQNIRVGIALPDNEQHNNYVERIKFGIENLGITLLWVDQNKQVRTDYF